MVGDGGKEEGGLKERLTRMGIKTKRGGKVAAEEVEDNKEETTWARGRGRLKWMDEREVVRGPGMA